MSRQLILSLIPDMTCIAVCIAATVTDLKDCRIPNRLTFPAMAVGLISSFGAQALAQDVAAGVRHGLLPALVGGGFLFLAFLAFNAAKGVGMGDVKLMAAVGAFLKWPLVIWALAFVLASGSLLAFIYAVKTGKLKQVFRNMLKGVKRLVKKEEEREPLVLTHMPYALAILTGVLLSVLYKYSSLF